MSPSFPSTNRTAALARVLLADDDRLTRMVLAKTLGDDYEIEQVANGVEALSRLGKWNPHVIVSDLEMPKLNGLALSRAVKGSRHLRHIPVVLITGHVDRDTIQDCFEAGADDYLPKPVDPRELRARVGAAVRGSLLAEELAETNRKLMRLSRRAGQAEVASGILHNVGNALNSVNINVKLLRDRTSLDVAVKLRKLHQLLQQNSVALESVMGERAAMLCEYCDALAAHEQERAEGLASELTQIERMVDHTKVVIASQQAFARGTGVLGPVDVTEVVRLAEDVAQSALGDVAVEKNVELVRFDGDECRIVQVLANLLANAAHAVTTCANPKILLACSEDSDAVHFVVEDNGIGIGPELLPRIFEHGATTRQGGNGFGLHYSINAAREMQGDLLVHSDGPNKGARFELIVPKRRSAESELGWAAPPSNDVQVGEGSK